MDMQVFACFKPLKWITAFVTRLGSTWLWWNRWMRLGLTAGPASKRRRSSATWFEASWTKDRAVTPYLQRGLGTGLRPIPMEDWLDIEAPTVFREQMHLRRDLLRGPREIQDRFYVSLGDDNADIRAAETEVLGLLIQQIEKQFPVLFSVDRSHSDRILITDHVTEEVFDTRNYLDCPLKLCASLVQEDFILLSPGDAHGEETKFVAGCALFTFMEIGLHAEMGNMKIGMPLSFIHQSVPDFKDHIGPKVNKFLSALKVETPYYRTNWLLVAEKGLNPLDYSLDPNMHEKEASAFNSSGKKEPQDMHLRVEYQCILRLPASRYVLFSLHTYSDPLPSLKKTPKAAAVLRQTILNLDSQRLRYRGMQPDWTNAVAEYLAQLAGSYC